MKKYVLRFGILAGVICGGMFYLDIPEAGEPMNFEDGHMLGYLAMILSLSTIFIAVWQYRKEHGNTTFLKSFTLGLLITLVASVLYVIGWEIFFQNFASDFSDQYLAFLQEQLQQQGLSETEVNEQLAPEKEMMESYGSNMPLRLGFTFLELFPIGLIISLVVASLFRWVIKPLPKSSL